MTRYAKSLLASVLLAAPILAGATGLAVAQMRPRPPMGFSTSTFDPAQLPEFKGKVAQYTLSPRGEVDGLILADGTEVQIPPHLSSALVFSVKPGDAVTIHGLKARSVAMIDAVTITNDASGLVVGASQSGRWNGPKMDDSGVIKALLHTPRGDVGGVLLEDGTVVRMPPPAAKKLGDLLTVGHTIAVRGVGVSGPLGKAIGAMEAGPSLDKLTRLEMPHWHHGPGGHGPMGHGPEGHGPVGAPGPDGAPPPPAHP